MERHNDALLILIFKVQNQWKFIAIDKLRKKHTIYNEIFEKDMHKEQGTNVLHHKARNQFILYKNSESRNKNTCTIFNDVYLVCKAHSKEK